MHSRMQIARAMVRRADALERIADALERDRQMHQLIQGMLQGPSDPEPLGMREPVAWFRDTNGKQLFLRYSDGSAVPTTMDEIKKLTAEGWLS